MDEQAGLESDTDWVGLVGALAKAAGQVAPAAIQAFTQAKGAQGYSLDQINQFVAAARGRAAGVQDGTATMPTAGWVGIGVGAAAILALLVFALARAR